MGWPCTGRLHGNNSESSCKLDTCGVHTCMPVKGSHLSGEREGDEGGETNMAHKATEDFSVFVNLQVSKAYRKYNWKK